MKWPLFQVAEAVFQREQSGNLAEQGCGEGLHSILPWKAESRSAGLKKCRCSGVFWTARGPPRPWLRDGSCRGERCSTKCGRSCASLRACVLLGAGCWAPSLRVQQLVSVQENRWLRCVLGGRKELDMEWVAWLRKAKRAAHSLRCRMKLPALWHRALAATHGWAGHLARCKEPHPGATVVFWRNAEWRELMKGAGATSSDHSKEQLGARLRGRSSQNLWRWVEGPRERRSPTLDGPKASFCG